MYANDIVFLLCITVLSILRPTVHSSMYCNLFMSVVLSCLLFQQIGNTLRNCRHVWQRQAEYNMWVWLWVGQWMWPVAEWLNITPKPIRFLSRLYETCFSTHPVLNAPEYVLVMIFCCEPYVPLESEIGFIHLLLCRNCRAKTRCNGKSSTVSAGTITLFRLQEI